VTGGIEEGRRGRVEWIVRDYWDVVVHADVCTREQISSSWVMKNEGNGLADRGAHIGIGGDDFVHVMVPG
jgi:hypothetical protein